MSIHLAGYVGLGSEKNVYSGSYNAFQLVNEYYWEVQCISHCTALWSRTSYQCRYHPCLGREGSNPDFPAGYRTPDKTDLTIPKVRMTPEYRRPLSKEPMSFSV